MLLWQTAPVCVYDCVHYLCCVFRAAARGGGSRNVLLKWASEQEGFFSFIGTVFVNTPKDRKGIGATRGEGGRAGGTGEQIAVKCVYVSGLVGEMMLLHLLSRLHATGTSAPSITLLRVSFLPCPSPALLPHAPNPSIPRPSSTLCSSPFVFLPSLPHVTQGGLVYAGPRPLLAGVAMIMVARRVRWGGLPCWCEVARSS